MGSLDVQPWQSSRLFRKLATCADARLSRLRPHLPSIGLLGPALHGRLEATWWRPPRCLYKSWRLLVANAATWRATWIHHMRLHSSSFDRYIYIYICVCVVFYVVLLDAEKAIQSPDLHTFWKTLWMCFLFHWEVFPWIQWGTMSKIRKYGLLTRAAAGGRRKNHVV